MCAQRDESGIPPCPRCSGQEVWKNGRNSAGNQQWRCKSCTRVFVVEPYIEKRILLIADRMLGENLPVSQIALVLAGFVSRRWIYVRKGVLNV